MECEHTTEVTKDIDLLVGVALEHRFAKASNYLFTGADTHFAMFIRNEKRLVIFGEKNDIRVEYSSFYGAQLDSVLADVEALNGALVPDNGHFRCTVKDFTAVGATYAEASMRALVKYYESSSKGLSEEHLEKSNPRCLHLAGSNFPGVQEPDREHVLSTK